MYDDMDRLVIDCLQSTVGVSDLPQSTDEL